MKKWCRTLPTLLLMAIVTACGGREIAEPQPADDLVQNDAAAPEVTIESVDEVETAATEVEVEPAPTQLVQPTEDVSAEELMSDGKADADVTWVRAVNNGDTWTFYVTVAHPDTGWEDYADGWDVLLPDGTVVKPDENSPFTRLLLHPHENEQPFTRSQGNIIIPAEVTMVRVRAHDLVDGFGGQEIALI